MIIASDKNAATKPAIRRKISLSNKPVVVLAARCAVSEDTVRRWRVRDSFEDRSHTEHRLQTTLTRAQEIVVAELRRMLLLQFDDLLATTRELLNPHVSRSGLDRCLRQYRFRNFKTLTPTEPATARKVFKAYHPGFLHIEDQYLPKMPDETSRRHLFVAVYLATRGVFVRIMSSKTVIDARRFLRELARACIIKILRIFTDNGMEFIDRLIKSRAREARGDHKSYLLCAELDIVHRLTKLRSSQTKGMVERLNGRISDVLKTNRLISGEDLENTILR